MKALPLFLEPVPATWFQKSRCWDPPPGRLAQCRPSGRHWCFPGRWDGVGARWYYSRCYPRTVVTKRSVSLDDEVASSVEEAAKQDGVSFSAWLSSAAERQLRVRQGLRGVAAWEGETGSLSAEELAAGEALLARLRSGVSGVASRVRRR